MLNSILLNDTELNIILGGQQGFRLIDVNTNNRCMSKDRGTAPGSGLKIGLGSTKEADGGFDEHILIYEGSHTFYVFGG